ncbi:hypothetical protein ACWGVU_47445, partial [Embleya sp. NPDC055610]
MKAVKASGEANSSQPPPTARNPAPRTAPMPGTLWTVSEFVCASPAFDESVHSGIYSLRAITFLAGVGDHCVVHTAEDRQLSVWVLAVGNRRDIHRQVPQDFRRAGRCRLPAGVTGGRLLVRRVVLNIACKCNQNCNQRTPKRRA